jgi:hypothetical protein
MQTPRLARRAAVVAVLLALAFAGRVDAQVNEAIRAGETRALATSTQPIAVITTPARGTAVVAETPGPSGRTYSLLYTAPATQEVFTETIKYTDPTEHALDVTVTPAGDQIYNDAAKSLFLVFVIALLLESGLAILFNWRPFLLYVDGRGLRTVISVIVAYVFVAHFQIDIVTRLVNVYSQRNPPFANHALGRFITALIIAGGSAAVNNILVSLGFRAQKTADQVTPKPAKTEAWVSVCFERKDAVGPVDVLIGDPAGGGPPVAGTIKGGRPPSALLRLFLRDPNRFPTAGGYAVPAHRICVVQLQGKDTTGKSITAQWGQKSVAPGAIVDLDITL